MLDIFDRVAGSPGGDIFDRVATQFSGEGLQPPPGDIFDKVASGMGPATDQPTPQEEPQLPLDIQAYGEALMRGERPGMSTAQPPDIDTTRAMKLDQPESYGQPLTDNADRSGFIREVVGPTALDAAGVTAKAGAGLAKGATMGAVDIERGELGIPFTSMRYKITPPLSETLKDAGVSPEIADNPYIALGPEFLGVVLPWSKVAQGVQYLTPAKLKAVKTGVAGVLRRTAQTGVTGGIVGAAAVRGDDESMLENAMLFAGTGMAVHLTVEMAWPVAQYIKGALKYKTVTKNITADDLFNAFTGRGDASPEALEFVKGLSTLERKTVARGVVKGVGVELKGKAPRFKAKSAEPPQPKPAEKPQAGAPKDIVQKPPAGKGGEVKLGVTQEVPAEIAPEPAKGKEALKKKKVKASALRAASSKRMIELIDRQYEHRGGEPLTAKEEEELEVLRGDDKSDKKIADYYGYELVDDTVDLLAPITHDGEAVTKGETEDILEEAGTTPKELKAQKAYLIAEINKAIKVVGKGPEKVRFSVPGDGVFNISNKKENLTSFMKQVSKSFPTKVGTKSQVPKRPSMKAEPKKAKGLKNMVPVVREGDEVYHTDGSIILKGEPKVKPRSVEEGRRFSLDGMKRTIPSKESTVEPTSMDFVTYAPDEEYGTLKGRSDQPIYKSGKDILTNARFRTPEGGYVYVDQNYYLYALEHYPDAEFRVSKKAAAKSPVLILSKGEPVGVVMPYDTKYSDDFFADLEEPTEKTASAKGATAQADTGGYSKTVKHLHAIEMPEIVTLAREISGGKYPKIRKMLRAGGGLALGQFQHSDGSRGTGNISLRADIFQDPDTAAKVLAHEIGHLVDWLPSKTLKRGNILGHVASLKGYTKTLLEEYPDAPGKVLTKKDRAKLRHQAERGMDVVEKKVVPAQEATPEEILAIWNDTAGREKDPALYTYIVTLSAKEKVAIVKAAMRGELPEWVSFKRGSYNEATQDIRELYQELLKEEIQKRRLLERDKILAELRALTQEWKPFNETIDPAFTKYRYSNAELYADAISVLVNDPPLLKQIAPTFRKAFLNYIERKPKFKAVYEGIQGRLKDKDAIREARSERLRTGFEKGEEVQKRLSKRTPLKILEGIERELIEKNVDIYQVVRKVRKTGGAIEDAENPIYWVSELPYISGKIYDYMRQIDHKILREMEKGGIAIDDLGEYMFHQRVIHERGKMANPEGFTPKTSEDQLQHLKEKLGADKYEKFDEYVDTFWEHRTEAVISLLEEAGMYSPELMAKIKNNEVYAAFDIVAALEKRYGRSVTGHIFKQIGTLEQIRNPFVATVMKDAALIRAAEITKTKKAIVSFLEKNLSGEVTPADTKWNGKYHEPIESKDPDKGLIIIPTAGKVKGYYVAKGIAESIQKNPYEAGIILKTWQYLNIPLREILVGRNPLWMAFNLIRDFKGTAKNIPGLTAPNLIKYYIKAFKDAYRDVYKDIPTEIVSKMLKNKMLVVERHFGAMDAPAETELDRKLRSFGKSEVRHRNLIIRPFIKFWELLGKTGKFTERWGKIAGYKYLTARMEGKEKGKGLFHKDTGAKLTEKKIAHFVRTRVGTPDIYRGGRLLPVYNNIFLFSNVAKEGWRASYKSAKDAPGEYAWKTIQFNIIPKIILMAVGAGYLGEKFKKVVDGASTYDKENYTIIPLGLTDEGKSVYLRIPQDYSGQVIGGVFWNLINGELTGKSGLLGYFTEQTPYGLNPYLSVGGDLIQYMRGLNPYDAYRGRYVLPEKVRKAGGRRAHKGMAKHIYNELGGSVLYKFASNDINGVESELELALKFPPGNILGRFLKISDYGEVESLRKISERVESEEFGEQLEVTDLIIEDVNRITGEGRKPGVPDIKSLHKALKGEGLLPATSSFGQFRHRYNRYASKSADNPKIDAVVGAKTTRQKVALLSHYKKTMSPGDYERIVKQLRKEGHISGKVIWRVNHPANKAQRGQMKLMEFLNDGSR